MQYVDDEGDKVLLATDTDLVAAVNFARISGWKVSILTLLCMIKIYVLFFNMCSWKCILVDASSKNVPCYFRSPI